MQDLTTTLVFDRSTKNKHLYKAREGSPEFLGSVYIEKEFMPDVPPEQIIVTVKDNSQ